MTIEELEDKLPNGFHDSFLVRFDVDLAAATCMMELDIDDDDPEPEVFRRMQLWVKGLSIIIVEPPAAQGPLKLGHREWTEGVVTTSNELPNLESYRNRVPSRTFFYSFLLRELDCFIHLAGTDAELRTVDSAINKHGDIHDK
jgi:hypothetical protein